MNKYRVMVELQTGKSFVEETTDGLDAFLNELGKEDARFAVIGRSVVPVHLIEHIKFQEAE